ncbi:hypothetical protein Mgra_00007762 [Meloidogyne graminicola]|uniref:Uncharacterized protein n=1 Tax=Meloidogyne graminicola TaxID=189291 RepID=A0A8S9ZHK1_9BILA|nr:hypothetical protein Mgra_00007762 [Meloidogyne graminicola]
MNVLKTNSSSKHQESTRNKLTTLQKKLLENRVKQINGHINTRNDLKSNKKNISDEKGLNIEIQKSSAIKKTSSISKKRRLGRENCDDIQFMKNNVKLPKQEITDDEKFPTFIKTPAGNFKKDQNNFPKIFSSLPTSSKHQEKNTPSRYSTALRKNSQQNNDKNKMEPWVKRNFYIVENAGIPTEIYCTDFIRNLKFQGGNSFTNSSRLDDQHNQNTLLRITDKWKEEWSTNGVQMPMGCRQDKYEFENTNILLGNDDTFTLPAKLISQYPARYVKEFPKDFQHVQRQTVEQVYPDYRPLRFMRLDYEKSRNLCYMITRREKLKKNALELFQEQVERAAANIFCANPVVPVSKRQVDKMLLELRNAVEFKPSTSQE